jgi:hypothetical protein
MQTANHENLRASLAPKDQIQVAAIFENKLMAKKKPFNNWQIQLTSVLIKLPLSTQAILKRVRS